MEKRVFLGILLLTLLSVSLVSAISPAPAMQGTNLPANVFQGLSDLLTGLLQTVGDVFEKLVGTSPLGMDEAVFARMILFVIVTVILFLPASKLVGEKPGFAWILAIGVSLLGVRFIDASTLNAVLLPYNVLTLALSTLIPLILYSIFIYSENIPTAIRKTGWWFFVACYLALYIWRAPKINGDASLIYLLSGGMAVVMALLDNKIDEMINQLRMTIASSEQRITMITNELNIAITQLEQIRLQLNREIAAGTAGKTEIINLTNNINRLEVQVHNLTIQLANAKTRKNKPFKMVPIGLKQAYIKKYK